jgi:hypothetical protein
LRLAHCGACGRYRLKPIGFEFGKGLGHAGQPELGELIEYRADQH